MVKTPMGKAKKVKTKTVPETKPETTDDLKTMATVVQTALAVIPQTRAFTAACGAMETIANVISPPSKYEGLPLIDRVRLMKAAGELKVKGRVPSTDRPRLVAEVRAAEEEEEEEEVVGVAGMTPLTPPETSAAAAATTSLWEQLLALIRVCIEWVRTRLFPNPTVARKGA